MNCFFFHLALSRSVKLEYCNEKDKMHEFLTVCHVLLLVNVIIRTFLLYVQFTAVFLFVLNVYSLPVKC